MQHNFNDKSVHQIKNKVRALILNEDKTKILILKVDDGDSYFMLPGGTQEFGETAAQTLEREIQEELGCQIKVGSLVLVRELLAQKQSTAIGQVVGKQFLELYFQAEALSAPTLLERAGNLKDAVWINIEDVKNIPLKPDYIKDNIDDILRQPTFAHRKTPIYVGNAL